MLLSSHMPTYGDKINMGLGTSTLPTYGHMISINTCNVKMSFIDNKIAHDHNKNYSIVDCYNGDV